MLRLITLLATIVAAGCLPPGGGGGKSMGPSSGGAGPRDREDFAHCPGVDGIATAEVVHATALSGNCDPPGEIVTIEIQRGDASGECTLSDNPMACTRAICCPLNHSEENTICLDVDLSQLPVEGRMTLTIGDPGAIGASRSCMGTYRIVYQ